MKKKINNRKVIGTIIGLIIFISCAFYFTYAFYQWKSSNSDVNLTIKDSTGGGECSNGPNVDVKNIGPVLNVSDGVKANFSVKNKSSSSISLTLGLKITSISNPLRVESFKYALYQDTTGNDTFDYSTNPILSGNFSKMSVGDNTLSTTLTVDKESTYSFQFIVYIDGNMENASSIMNSSLSASITYGDCNSFIKPLSTVTAGSYVKYTGTNGCTGKSCEGQNANYVSDTDMGYCYGSDYKYNANGWRVAYVKDGTAYLTSAGSPECMCTSKDGTPGISCSDYEETGGLPKHIANLNAKALTYCNSTYAYGGKCDSNSAWNMADADFQAITGDTLSTAHSKSDGYYDSYSLIDNGGFYWFAATYLSSPTALGWYPNFRIVANDRPRIANGLRPVLRLASSVIVTGGSGTYEDPYTITKKITKLSEADSGSYVKYTGNNGCSGKSCEGQNANYVSDTDMGYCDDSSYKFNANGWRVAYVKDGTAYLTSAGSTECMCTSKGGTAGTSCGDNETTAAIPKHLANLNKKALTYCNIIYAYGGKCDSNSAWNMADADFQVITGDTLSTAFSKSNYDSYSIINNGGFYWFATPDSSSSTDAFYWFPRYRVVYNHISSRYALGLRPVLRLQSSVKVTGGSGTYEDPYTISNGNTKLSEVAPGSYVKYTGNNGCSGKSCEGQNANYVSDTDMGYCYNPDYKYNANGWRVAYVKDGTAYLTSAGSPECMCTSSDGTAGTNCRDSFETTNGGPKHIANLTAKALTYCNSTYAYGGKCDSNSAWNMVDADFQAITGDTLSTANDKSNYDSYSLINNGGYYWFATPESSSSMPVFCWSPIDRNVRGTISNYVGGLRPVLRFASSVVVTGGTGTYKDPYIISNG